MKKFGCLLLMLVLSFSLFSACSGNDELYGDTNSITISSSEIVSSISPSPTPPSKNVISDIDFTSITKDDFLKNTQFYLISNPSLFSLSHKSFSGTNLSNLNINQDITWQYSTSSIVYNNHQLLSLENYHNLNEYSSFFKEIKLDMISNDNSYTILAKDYYTQDSTNYNYLTDDVIMIYQGEHAPSISKVKYIDYIQDTTLPKGSWDIHFNSVINNFISKNQDIIQYDTYTHPIMYSKSWEVFDGENLIEVVVAQNILGDTDIENFSLESHINENPPSNIDNLLYQITITFINGEISQTFSSLEVIPPESYSIPESSNHLYIAYKYNKTDNNINLTPVYSTDINPVNIETMLLNDSYLFVDVNCDNSLDLITNNDYFSTSFGIAGVTASMYNRDNRTFSNIYPSLEAAGIP